MPSKEPPARKGYHDADIVGYHVKAMLAGDAQAEQVLCSDQETLAALKEKHVG